jgi:hypothetical protein
MDTVDCDRVALNRQSLVMIQQQQQQQQHTSFTEIIIDLSGFIRRLWITNTVRYRCAIRRCQVIQSISIESTEQTESTVMSRTSTKHCVAVNCCRFNSPILFIFIIIVIAIV